MPEKRVGNEKLPFPLISRRSTYDDFRREPKSSSSESLSLYLYTRLLSRRRSGTNSLALRSSENEAVWKRSSDCAPERRKQSRATDICSFIERSKQEVKMMHVHNSVAETAISLQ